MNGQARQADNLVLPPWLWLWLLFFFFSIPDKIITIQTRIVDLFSTNSLPGEDIFPLGILARLANFIELLPEIVLLLGVLTIFLPWLRSAYLERKYRLSEPPDLAALQEMRVFLSKYAPSLEIRTNILRSDQLAFVYPLSYRKYAIGIFAGLVKLWRKNQVVAQTILLHEVAHYRQRVGLIVGAGSFFEGFLRRWLLFFISLVVIPLLLVGGYEAIRLEREAATLKTIGVSIPLSQLVLQNLQNAFLIYLPGLLRVIVSTLFWTISIIILPLIGLWCAELNADRLAILESGSPESLLSALGIQTKRSHPWNWLLNWMSHPPDRLRHWMARHVNTTIGMTLLLLIFPLAFLIRLFALLGFSATAGMSSDGNLLAGIRTYFENSSVVWFVLLGILLVWPLIPRFRDRSFNHGNRDIHRAENRGYFITALLVTVLAVTGVLSNTTRYRIVNLPTKNNAVEAIQWPTGSLVDVEWQGGWYPAQILESSENSFRVHYESYDSSWDEWVDGSRIRARAP